MIHRFTPSTSNILATALVLGMLALGCLFGYATFGRAPAPAGAATPPPSPGMCLTCVHRMRAGGGNVPAPVQATGQGMGGNVPGR